MDYALGFGVGRQTAYRFEEITQTLPTDEDIFPFGIPPDAPRSPFPFAAKQMISYGPLINMLNRDASAVARMEADIQAARSMAIKEYNQLPQDMQWNVGK